MTFQLNDLSIKWPLNDLLMTFQFKWPLKMTLKMTFKMTFKNDL